jgi:NAD(P)-dependent dehydrogenase (short-subunit alcohol dehydrogenase family)
MSAAADALPGGWICPGFWLERVSRFVAEVAERFGRLDMDVDRPFRARRLRRHEGRGGLARDLAGRDITVNVLQPGFIDTDMNPGDGAVPNVDGRFGA